MTGRYVYEISRRDEANGWHVAVTGRGVSTRDPKSTARSVIERWINDHLEQLPGGQVFVFGSRKTREPKGITTSVQVRIYSIHPTESPRILAVAYIGHHNRNDRTWPKTRLQEWLTHVSTP